MMHPDWTVDLFPGWRVKPNPEGNGMILCVDRTSRQHTQVLSDWMTVEADALDVESHLADCPHDDSSTYREQYRQVAQHLEVLAESMFTDMGWYQAVETVGLTVHYNILRSITRGAESHWRLRQTK